MPPQRHRIPLDAFPDRRRPRGIAVRTHGAAGGIRVMRHRLCQHRGAIEVDLLRRDRHHLLRQKIDRRSHRQTLAPGQGRQIGDVVLR